MFGSLCRDDNSTVIVQAKKQQLPYVFLKLVLFGSFGQLAVQAAQILAVFGRQTW
jgi:hypothetical protein